MLIKLLQDVESRVEGEWEVGKIYDLLFVRVVKMCSVSSFHTKDIKLDSINNRALVQEWTLVESDVKSELFFLRMMSMTCMGVEENIHLDGKQKKNMKNGLDQIIGAKKRAKREKRNAMRKWMGINSIGGECNG